MSLKERAAALKTDIPAVFLALKAKETPLIAKIAAGITVAYALSPIDLIPDFVPILGYLDDVILLPALVSLTLKLIPSDIMISNSWGTVFHLFSGSSQSPEYSICPIQSSLIGWTSRSCSALLRAKNYWDFLKDFWKSGTPDIA